MAEYYPLLARAVASMRNAPPEQRRAIYDRARQALLGQLRSMQPPVPTDSINRESNALDEAIARVEAEITAPPAAAAVPPRPVDPPPVEGPPPPPVATAAPTAIPLTVATPPAAPPPAPAPRPTSRAPPPAAAPSAPQAPAPSVVTPPAATIPAAPPAPAPAPPVAVTVPEPPVPIAIPSPPRTGPARPAADALNRIVSERGPQPLVLRAERPGRESGGAVDPAARVAPAMPSAPRLQVTTFADAMASAGQDPASAGDTASESAGSATSTREDTGRPPAPRPSTRERFNPRFLILAVVGAVVVAGIAYAAYRLRDRPESLARSHDAMAAARKADQESAKISTRVVSEVPTTTPVPTAGQPVSASAEANKGGVPADTPDRAVSPAVPNTSAVDVAKQAAAPDVAPAASPGDGVTIPVAQRAAFLVDAPDEPQKVKTFVGTVVWTTDNASPGQNLPLARTVHADVDIPDAGLKLAVVFQKNDEVQFPASHTLEMRFTIGAGNTFGSIKQISVPQMRKDDSPAGDALVGLPVTITDNYFLVGLSRGDATQHNLDLIKTRNWFDVPILLASSKVGKITFEKGGPGDRAIADVMQSWR